MAAELRKVTAAQVKSRLLSKIEAAAEKATKPDQLECLARAYERVQGS
jgi:hypothetical protein